MDAHLLPCWSSIFDIHRLNFHMEAHFITPLELLLDELTFIWCQLIRRILHFIFLNLF